MKQPQAYDGMIDHTDVVLFVRAKDGHGRLRWRGERAEGLDGLKVRLRGAESTLRWRAKRERAVAPFDREQTVMIVGQ